MRLPLLSLALVSVLAGAGCASRPIHGMRPANPDQIEVVFTDGTALLIDKTAKSTGTKIDLEAIPPRHSWPVDVLEIYDALNYTYFRVVDGSGIMKDAIFAGYNKDLCIGYAKLPASDVAPERTLYLVARKQPDGSWVADGLPVMRFASLPEGK